MVQTVFMVMKIHWETSGEHLINQSMPNDISPTNHLISSSFYILQVSSPAPLCRSPHSDNKSMSRREIKLQAVNTQWSLGSLHSPRQISRQIVSVTPTAELSWASLGHPVLLWYSNPGLSNTRPASSHYVALALISLFIKFGPPQCLTIKFIFYFKVFLVTSQEDKRRFATPLLGYL